jgi:type II secretory pathway predicted ATPase ExeA
VINVALEALAHQQCELPGYSTLDEMAAAPVVLIDEAHLLDNQEMATVRMLKNHDMDSGAPFAAVLIGQPTLGQRLRLGVLASLGQRISVRYTSPA